MNLPFLPPNHSLKGAPHLRWGKVAQIYICLSQGGMVEKRETLTRHKPHAPTPPQAPLKLLLLH